jgi:hypothetical protein
MEKDKFKNYCNKLFGQYKNNIKLITTESTDLIFNKIKSNTYELHKTVKIKKLGELIGKFYIIKYDYNGNHIWCPIFIIDDRYKPDVQKRIIYAINLDYLPINFRVIFFNFLFDKYQKTIEINKDKYSNIKNQDSIEKPLKINFDIIYKYLNNFGSYTYCITAYDFDGIHGMLKGSPEIYYVSFNFTPRLMFIDTKPKNLKNMKDLSIILDKFNLKNKLNELISYFDKIKEDLNINEQLNYYKKLRSLENKYKLLKKREIIL